MKNYKNGNGVIGLIVIIGIIWLGYSYFIKDDSDYNSYNNYSDNFSSACEEPENPYSYGSGHYAGWEWGEQGNYCNGNSNSFVEGCEEYQAAEDSYEECLN